MGLCPGEVLLTSLSSAVDRGRAVMTGTLGKGGATMKPKCSPLLDTNKVLSELSCVYFITSQGIVRLQQGLVSIVEVVWPTKPKLFPTALFY